MKKILFASTALVATAGVAAAEVTISGYAEMGIFNPSTEDAETQFFTDLDVTFTMSGEADNGLVFGATIDLDEAADNNNPGRFERPEVQGGENMFVSFGGATLTMGDTDGALDARVPEMALAAGSLADDETAHAGFNHMDGVSDLGTVTDTIGLSLDGLGDGQVARFDYAYQGFIFSVSAEQVAQGADAEYADGSDLGDTIWAAGVSYAGEFSGVDLTAGLGYQDLEDFGNVTSLAVTGGFTNGLSLGATYSTADFDVLSDDVEHYGVAVGYAINAFEIGVNWGTYEAGSDSTEGYGLAASYDLGGGLVAQLGYGHSEYDVADIDTDDNTWSLGLAMSF
ncbi:porin [Salipiger sp. PrR003]|uniref:porin n=1 Tax=Salipiger sp. PrR003 TaxID=2706776 RepID=UPI0013DB393E|nr:porin [Salipiger sp. PrR003]NDV54067.1 porin [Salipiger sp. PrR003]